jgi:uncharacterized protein (TIGR03437 family)
MLQSKIQDMGTRSPAFLGSLLLVSLLTGPATLLGRGPADSSGHYHNEWDVLNALGRQARMEMQLRREGRIRLFAEGQPAPARDAGNIAIIDDDGTILVPANAFDLAYRSLRFTPDGAGYRVAAGATALDSGAAGAAVTLNLDDDDSREVPIGFNFPFNGRSYSTVFVNSDGNLTFGSGDSASRERDLARFLVDAPRVAPFFSDLNPADGGRLSYLAEPGRFVVTWQEVPECCAPPARPFSTIQVTLLPDGGILFAYGMVLTEAAVVGISPGSYTADSGRMVDLSRSSGNEVISTPLAEVFLPSAEFSEATAAQRFYAAHDDAYDYLVFWTNFAFSLGESVFAYEMGIANQVTGIGDATYDYSSWFGSGGRMSSFVLMGDMGRYPADPSAAVPYIPPKTTLSALGEETGHRWLAHLRYPYGGDPKSTILLGRDNDHWSFFFNSDASLMEGNRIRDNGDGSFTTVAVVEHYNHFDQYAMGLRAPEEVAPSFVVTNTDISNPSRAPLAGIRFRGTRMEVTIDGIVQANGPRLPRAAVAQKNFRMAFVLVNGKGSTATAAQIQQLDNIRQQYEAFWAQATDGRAQADTRLLRSLALRGLPVSAVAGAAVAVRLQCAAIADTPRSFRIGAAAGNVQAPGAVVVPAGAREAEFRVTTTAPGVARLTASADGFETAEGALAVLAATEALVVEAVSGGGQVGAPSATLADPLMVQVRDANGLAVTGATVLFSADNATFNPASAVTDSTGRAQTRVTLGPAAGDVTVSAAVSGGAAAAFKLTALAAAIVPAGSAVNGASFAPAPAMVSPGSIVSIFGSNLAAETRVALSAPLPTRLSATRVEINGIAAPLFLVSPGQVNAQVPFEISSNTATLTVDNGAARSTPISLALAPSAPGIFTLQSGTGPAAALHNSGYSLVTAASPATAGEVVAIYCTGLGAVSPAVQTGRAAPSSRPAAALQTPQVLIGGTTAQVLFAGLAPGFVGLYQVNVRVPGGLPAGAASLVLQAGLTSNTATLSIR